MGCGKSRLDHGVDSNDNDKMVTRDGNVVENETETTKIEAVEAIDTLMQGSEISGRSGSRLKHSSTREPTITNRKLSGERKSENGREIDLNAWGEKKTKKIALKPQRDTQNDSEFESEYGRDGVDLTSTHVTNDCKAEKQVTKPLGLRSSPDGANFTNCSEEQSRTLDLQKVESDETFDPSTLIDVEKFKAANAPTKLENTSANDSENANENGVFLAVNNNNMGEVENPTTPTNYNEFYDDDEKELMASIEKNIVKLPSPVLPGSVI